ncbi:MAG: hypothetical protein ABF876_05160 [Acetobacter aceti]
MDESTRQAISEALGRATSLRHRIAVTTGNIERASRAVEEESREKTTKTNWRASAEDTETEDYLSHVMNTGTAALTAANPRN